ncbi:apolipo protein O-domain-containing protein [Cristinia sonorae]|uniref:MICOS complex subunit n=1 Tax=Cristinia sonorae TaxID=1940300 RepID=A0A8K0XKF9_9AGAR|nr:apolipo protein O-domain-containing protein [Cristinia sonorae]
MFRPRLPRRTAWAVFAAVPLVHQAGDKLPIYPRPDPEIVLQENPSELERQIGIARRAVTHTYLEGHAKVQEVVSRWIGVEQAVEHRVKSIVAADEPLTPGILYVGVATLTGSIIARNRFIGTRLLLPPTLFLLSLNHFLPKTSHNLSAYFSSLEQTYFPALAEKHAIANAHASMTWERAKEATKDGRETLSGGVVALVGKLQDATGLKLRESLGLGQKAVENAQLVVEREVVEAKEAVERKAEEVKAAAEKKWEDAKEEAKKLV